ncbi:hypothetical protein RJT34_03603 [Clitoria ternatea]|uniref:F-box associated beta-propeller type 1 domain-containing protein n=1 Tax=Clitoria ternatea TaxID=43366 RepID=A0AAN9KLY4_CLITE
MQSLINRFKSLSEDLFNLFNSLKQKLIISHPSNPLLILDCLYCNNKIFCHHLFLLDVKRKQLEELHLPKLTDSDMGFKVVGSCNGLLCFTLYTLDPTFTILLWNPATRQTKRILEPQNALLPYKVPPNCLIGFYFNNSDNDYYVVRLHSFEDTDNTCLSDSLGKVCSVRVEKYSLSKGLWKEIKFGNGSVTVNGCLFWTENSVTLEGTLYWVATEVSDKYEDLECWVKLQTIGVFSRLERPVGIRKNEVFMASDKVIHSVSGTVALIPKDGLEVGAEFSYNVFDFVESYIALNGGKDFGEGI